MTEEHLHQRAADAGWIQKQQRRIAELEALLEAANTRISMIASQLQEADTTATAMGLALTEARMENERLREALSNLLFASENADELGYIDGEGWIDLERIQASARTLLDAGASPIEQLKAAIGTCTCITKTPAVEHHSKDCKYRAIMERVDLGKEGV